MKIPYKNYYLDEEQGRFNLYVKRDGNKSDTHIGYGYNLETALERILQDITCSAKETMDLRSFLSQYRQEKEELIQCIQNTLKVSVIK